MKSTDLDRARSLTNMLREIRADRQQIGQGVRVIANGYGDRQRIKIGPAAQSAVDALVKSDLEGQEREILKEMAAIGLEDVPEQKPVNTANGYADAPPALVINIDPLAKHGISLSKRGS